jgi:hypothetical protein
MASSSTSMAVSASISALNTSFASTSVIPLNGLAAGGAAERMEELVDEGNATAFAHFLRIQSKEE